jgi:hypothetical protein
MTHCQRAESVIAARYANWLLEVSNASLVSSRRCIREKSTGASHSPREDEKTTRTHCVSPRKEKERDRENLQSARRLKSNSRPSATPQTLIRTRPINFHPRAPRIYVGAFYNAPLDKWSAQPRRQMNCPERACCITVGQLLKHTMRRK